MCARRRRERCCGSVDGGSQNVLEDCGKQVQVWEGWSWVGGKDDFQLDTLKKTYIGEYIIGETGLG